MYNYKESVKTVNVWRALVIEIKGMHRGGVCVSVTCCYFI